MDYRLAEYYVYYNEKLVDIHMDRAMLGGIHCIATCTRFVQSFHCLLPPKT